MSSILFDSAKAGKSQNFGRGLLRYIPSSTRFEPSDEDRAWAAREFGHSDRTTAELKDIANREQRISRRIAECRAASQRCEAILNDQAPSMPPVSGGAPTEPSGSDWNDYALWCARLEEMNEGIEFEPRSTPISDQDIENVNVAG